MLGPVKPTYEILLLISYFIVPYVHLLHYLFMLLLSQISLKLTIYEF
jgi:hypothetical protein